MAHGLRTIQSEADTLCAAKVVFQALRLFLSCRYCVVYVRCSASAGIWTADDAIQALPGIYSLLYTLQKGTADTLQIRLSTLSGPAFEKEGEGLERVLLHYAKTDSASETGLEVSDLIAAMLRWQRTTCRVFMKYFRVYLSCGIFQTVAFKKFALL